MKFVMAFVAMAAILVVQGRAQAPPRPAAAGADPPRLVVLLVVDQFRADYVDMYGGEWTQGLKELFTKGAYFSEAAYPYGTTVTCAGHSTIGTGTLPSTHGMVANEWFDPATRAFVTCTEDPAAQALAFGGGTGIEHHSAKRLLVPTFADELRRQSRHTVRVVSMGGKARSAIGMAGHGGLDTAIFWEEDTGGTWATSSALAKSLSPEVNAYIKAHPIAAARGQNWDRALPETMYRYTDKATGEPTDGTFPHLLVEPIRTSRTTATFVDLWDRTPLVDGYMGDLAGSLVQRLQLGQRQGTDVLAIGFSGLDTAGHTYGPRSHEVQDTLARLDQILGRLFGELDKMVGRDRYVVALSADHGVALLPEQADPAMNAGRLSSLLPVGTAMEAVLDKTLGPGSYIEAMSSGYVYFRPGVLERIQANPTLIKGLETAAIGVRGIANVYWANDLATTSPTNDPVLAKVRKSYMKGRSGDLLVVQRPYWVVVATGTNHGSPYDYDARVPVAFLGAGIKPGRYTTTATPVDIAPTLASLTHVTLPRTDGRVLSEGLLAVR